MSVPLQVALCVVVMVAYLRLTVWWLERHWSEFERDREKLRRATDELQQALGEELKPLLRRLAQALAKMGGHDGLD